MDFCNDNSIGLNMPKLKPQLPIVDNNTSESDLVISQAQNNKRARLMERFNLLTLRFNHIKELRHHQSPITI